MAVPISFQQGSVAVRRRLGLKAAMASLPRIVLFHFDADVPFIVRLVAALELIVPGLHVNRVELTGQMLAPDSLNADVAVLAVSNESVTQVGARYIRNLIAGFSGATRIVLVSNGTMPGWLRELPNHQAVEFEGQNRARSDPDFRKSLRMLTDFLLDTGISSNDDEGEMSVALSDNVLVKTEDGGVEFNPALFIKLSDLAIRGPVRQALSDRNLFFLGDLVRLRGAELLRITGSSNMAVEQIEDVLGRHGLKLGSNVPGWPPENLDYQATRSAIARRVSEIRQAPLGVKFEADADSLFINPSGEDTDFKAAEAPVVQQLHEAIVRKTIQFASVAGRLDNQPGWQGIASLGDRLVFLLNRPTHRIPEVIGSLYSSALELGSFLELDRAISTGASPYSVELDPEARRPLEDLVRSLAPWIRSFPTIRQMDDEAGQFLARESTLRRSEQVIQTANSVSLIREEDAAALVALMDSAQRGDFQGSKAGHRGIMSVRNMIVASASVLGSFFLSTVGSDYATKSLVVQKAGSFLAGAEGAITSVLADLPSDLQFALQALIKDLRESPIVDPANSRRAATPPAPVRGRRPRPRE